MKITRDGLEIELTAGERHAAYEEEEAALNLEEVYNKLAWAARDAETSLEEQDYARWLLAAKNLPEAERGGRTAVLESLAHLMLYTADQMGVGYRPGAMAAVALELGRNAPKRALSAQ